MKIRMNQRGCSRRRAVVRSLTLALSVAMAATGCSEDAEGPSSDVAVTADAIPTDAAVGSGDVGGQSDATSALDAHNADTVTSDEGASGADDIAPTIDVSAAGDTSPAVDAGPQDATGSDAAIDADGTSMTDGGVSDVGGPDGGVPLPCGVTHILWDQSLGHAAGKPLRVAAMPDGGLAVASSAAGKAEIWRRSSTGGAAWKRAFQPAQGAQTNALAPYNGGSLLIAGQRGASTKTQGWLAALDAKGQVLWQHTVQYADMFNGKQVLSDGPLTDVAVIADKPVAVGYHAAPSGSGKLQSSLTWFAASGQISAQDSIFLGGSTRAEAVGSWEQGGVVVAGIGYGQSVDGDVFVTTWVSPGKAGGTHGIVQLLPTTGQEQVVGVVSLGQGRVAVAGHRSHLGQTQLFLMLLDGTGKGVSQVNKGWPKAPATAAHGLWRSSLGGLLIAAEAAPTGGLQGPNSDSWLLEFGPGGDVVWERDVSVAAAADYVADVAALSDGKLAVVGAAAGVLRAMRTSPWGHPSCASAGKCAAVALEACADGNPCTAANCEAASGCQSPAFAQGTPCPAGVCSVGVCGP